jgi:hypothetical protein
LRAVCARFDAQLTRPGTEQAEHHKGISWLSPSPEQFVYPRRIRWRWGVLAAIPMMLLSLYPQVHFWVLRGSQWNGSYLEIEGVGDEVAYCAYVNALIEGRPRKNNPYTGRDFNDHDGNHDSLFSIQFVPAYLIALPARLLGISAATAFIFLSPIAAGAAALALFWLLTLATGQEKVAAAGVIVVLCLGTLVGGHGHVSSFFGRAPLYNYLMFLRRYQPAATFPLFLIFCGAAWLSVTLQRKKGALCAAALAASLFSLLVFSYAYLWTAAAAWLACLVIWLVVARRDSFKRNWQSFTLLTVGMMLAVAGFAALYAQRASTLESVQALELSRAPDLFRVPELVGIGLLITIAYYWRRGFVEARDPRVLLAASFALLPLVVFNQQVITGRSLQPLHYEMFVANYSALIAVVIGIAAILRNPTFPGIRMPKKSLLWLALVAFEWGAYETLVATRGSVPLGIIVDDARAVALRLAEISQREPGNEEYPTLLSTDLLVAGSLPTTSPHSVLWAPHSIVFSGLSEAENKERFYQYLYFTGISPEQLRSIFVTAPRYGYGIGLFGSERTIKGLSREPKPITREELETEVNHYSNYLSSFNAEEVRKVKISYVVAGVDEQLDFSNFDRWYERDSGERIGRFMLFRARLKEHMAGGQFNQ